MNNVITVKESLESLQNKIKARKRKLAEIDLLIEGTIEKLSVSNTLLNRTDLAIAKTERANLVANILFLEQEVARLKQSLNGTSDEKPSLEQSEEIAYY